MGFGSYDETEQDRQRVDPDDVDEDPGVDTSQVAHEGSVRYEIGASNDELLETLQRIKDE